MSSFTLYHWDHDGGYAEYVTVPEGFAYRLPEKFDSLEAAPLLCAGIIGYRALNVPMFPAGGRLGYMASVAQRHIGPRLHLPRELKRMSFYVVRPQKKFALELGCASVQGSYDPRQFLWIRQSFCASW